MFMAPASMIPMFLLSGFFVKIETMPSYLKPVTYLTYWRYAFEAIIVAIYGQNRCSAEGLLSDIEDTNNLSECSLITRLLNVMKKAEIGVDSIKSWAGGKLRNASKGLRRLRVAQFISCPSRSCRTT